MTRHTSRLRIVVSGSIAQRAIGGMTWHHLQYLLGLARLGHEVYYFEDTGRRPYDARLRSKLLDPGGNVAFLARLMSRFGLEERWAYCHLSGDWMGLSERKVSSIVDSADLLINVSGVLSRPLAYRSAPRLVYIDTDPFFNQLKMHEDGTFRDLVDAHDVLFTFGERLASSASAPSRRWIPTRQPVVLSEWHSPADHRNVFSTVMTWVSKVHKQKELRRFADLPRLVGPRRLEIALNAPKDLPPVELLRAHGWRIVDPYDVCSDLDSYRSYIESSMGEWSVAKSGYARAKPGWFSERSACYLAAGRPVVVEDTGFSSILPVGEGILPFTTVEEAAAGIEEVTAHYRLHSNAARSIAAEYFDSRKVLERLVDQALAAQPMPSGGLDVAGHGTAHGTGSSAVQRQAHRRRAGGAERSGADERHDRDRELLRHRPSSDQLTAGLASVFRRLGYGEPPVAVLERAPELPYGSSPADILLCRTPDGGAHRLFCKYAAPETHLRHGHRGGVSREAFVYQSLLQEREAPESIRYYGSHVGPDGRHWLILEYLEHAERLAWTRTPELVYAAARWIGKFHASQQARGDARAALPLIAYDENYYTGWIRRTREYSSGLPSGFSWVGRVCDVAPTILQRLLAAPHTVIHGEYYPKNVMIRDGRVYPVDWESAALAPGEIDLASLIERWPPQVCERCRSEYANARWPSGAPDDFLDVLTAARIYLHFRWLGDRPSRTAAGKSGWRFTDLRALVEGCAFSSGASRD
jgi:hypothetical protein